MNASMAGQSIVETLRAWWRDRREADRQLDEIASLNRRHLEDVAADCGVSAHDLLAVIKAGAHASDEMREMLRALNIDDAALEANSRHLYNDMIATCTECKAKAECRRDLRSGHAADNYTHYCPNAETINEVRAKPEMLAG